MTARSVDVANAVKRVAGIQGLRIHDPKRVRAIAGIRVIDVGQGDCIGLLNQRGQVFCYVDYGGCNDHPDKRKRGAIPSAHRMPVRFKGKYVPVILTHWDKDHCWSAASKNTEAQKCPWIVPRQFVAPQVLRLAAKLKNARRWPESIGDAAVDIPIGKRHKVTIRKCGPFDASDRNADRNLTGLAVTVTRCTKGVDKAIILLPGDCPFDRIPNWDRSLPIRALVAYHHGSKTYWTAATASAIKRWTKGSKLTYSVGANSYGHPHVRLYDPHWNTRASHTGDARRRHEPSIDMTW